MLYKVLTQWEQMQRKNLRVRIAFQGGVSFDKCFLSIRHGRLFIFS